MPLHPDLSGFAFSGNGRVSRDERRARARAEETNGCESFSLGEKIGLSRQFRTSCVITENI